MWKQLLLGTSLFLGACATALLVAAARAHSTLGSLVLADLYSRSHDGFRACLADGSRSFIWKGTSEAVLRAAITRNGGEALRVE